MKTRTFVSILILVLAVSFTSFLIVSCGGGNGGNGGNGDNGGPAPEPEIQLWQDGIPLGLGADYDFGSVCNETCTTVTFTIENVGTADLNLTGAPDTVTMSGTDAALFTVASQPSSPIAPNDSSSFTVRFSTASSGETNATMSIENDDPDASSFTLSLTATGFEPPAKVPATGQSTSHATGDDGDLQRGVSWPASRFTDNQDGTVTDTLTGLMWEQAPSGSIQTWQVALNYANDLSLGGFTDWRLANVRELQSLINVEQANPAGWLNTQGFSGAISDDYWSSTTSASNPNMACVLRTDEGGAMGRTTKVLFGGEYGWAVRDDDQSGSVAPPKSGQTSSYYSGDDGNLEQGVSWPSPRFRDNQDATITDNLTGLVWEKTPSATEKTWAEALTYANDLALGDFSDWRLANKNELWSLIHYGSSNSASWLGGQGFTGVQTDTYWTSTTYAGDTTLAWAVYMETGNMGYSIAAKTSSAYFGWAVRGGQ